MTVIAIGPHPDDPEEGMGGTFSNKLMTSHNVKYQGLCIACN